MKKTLPIFLILLLLIYASSCEKDDICVDGDTPQLIIGFYDVEDTTEFKSVSSLRIRAVDIDSIFSSTSFADRSNSPDSLLIPLRIDGNSTTYEFISDSADDETTGDETGNLDVLTISYETREEFISRACGFVINYDNLNLTLPDNSENWIQDIRIVQQTIENTDNIHVKIFH
ncbi:DUF6452 family protein [Flagellimonas nanhaiensis]|uniref:DUF1735 domain-containing protein n=1 Tax=Flagellimonas nanhaiensis TaxID=2292706 RepID=A0A371JMB1_9FLAO|nr:DUF6452 family protein [Allomuricauda nanhaiensis]RDY58283.1 hypothetical protein DX873_14795 [Allomuricauda nanhaiensis]